MSLISEYERMLDIKNRCIAKLIKKGVPASEHEMEDFPSDIESISGIDVSNTTAERKNVLSTKYFYDKDGNYVEGTMKNIPWYRGKLSPKVGEVAKSTLEMGFYATGAIIEAPEAYELSPEDDNGSTIYLKDKIYIPSKTGWAFNHYVELNFKNVELSLNDTTKGATTVPLDPDHYYLIICKAWWNVAGGSQSTKIEFSEPIENSTPVYDLSAARTGIKIAFVNPRKSGISVTLTTGGTSSTSSKQIYEFFPTL